MKSNLSLIGRYSCTYVSSKKGINALWILLEIRDSLHYQQQAMHIIVRDSRLLDPKLHSCLLFAIRLPWILTARDSMLIIHTVWRRQESATPLIMLRLPSHSPSTVPRRSQSPSDRGIATICCPQRQQRQSQHLNSVRTWALISAAEPPSLLFDTRLLWLWRT